MKKIILVLLSLFSTVGFGQPDLRFQTYFAGAPGATHFRGEELSWDFTVINSGITSASVVDYEIRLSEDINYDTSDILLKSGKIAKDVFNQIGLNAGDSKNIDDFYKGHIKLPLDIEINRTYYFIFWIEQDINNGETNIANNVVTQSVYIGLRNLVSVAPKDGSALGDRRPLLLIHGWQPESVPAPPEISMWDNLVYYYDNDQEFKDNFKIYYVRYYSNLISVDEIGHELRYDLDEITEFQDKEISIVAHSMGGLVSRSFMNRIVYDGYYSGQPGGDRVNRLITLGTPHHGSPMANGDSRVTAFSFDPPILLFNKFDDAILPAKFDKYSRIDLYWDNYRSPNLLDFSSYPAEYNSWLSSNQMNNDTSFDLNIIAYAGTFDFLDVPSNPLYSPFPPYIKHRTFSGYYFGNRILTDMWINKYNEFHLNDGIVPISSALFYNHTILKRRLLFGYNHKRIAYGMSNYHKVLAGDEEPDYLLFNNIKNDLLENNLISQINVFIDNLEFPQTAIGNSITKNITLQNVGDLPLTISSIQLIGVHNSQFTFNFPSVPFDMEPNETESFTVDFAPTSIGEKDVIFRINNSSVNNPQLDIQLTGEAVQMASTDYNTNISTLYDFGDVYIYGGSELVTLAVSNSSSAPYTVAGLSITGLNADLFSIVQQPVLPKQFNPGDSETIILSFDPDTIGEKTAMIEASFQNNTILDTANLIGNGVNTIANPNAPKLTFSEYWFNDDYSARQTSNLSAENSLESLSFDAMTTGVNKGLNILHFRVKDDESHWSSILSEFVYVQNASNSTNNTIVDYEYWYDNDYAGRTVGSGTGSNPLLLDLDDNVGSLDKGLHQFHIRFKDEKGAWSSIVSEFIYNDKPSGLGSNKIAAYRLWFNDDFVGRTSGAFTPEETIIFLDDIDVSGLATNTINHIHFQFKDIYGNWSSVLTEEFLYETLVLNSTVVLQGALTNPFVGEENLMRDNLRTANLLPTTSPYADGLLCDTSVFDTTGADAIVDWVWLELRNSSDRTVVVEGRSALLQRDGDIVNMDGVSAVNFNATADDYYLLVQHRNHLSVLSAMPVAMSTSTIVDLSSDPLLVFGGSNAVIDVGGIFAMISGDALANGQIQNSDVNEVRPQLGTSGYTNFDTDMNGQVQNSDINVSIRSNIGRGIQF